MFLFFAVVLLIGGMLVVAMVARMATRRGEPPSAGDGEEVVNVEKLAVYNIYQLEGLVRLLVGKGMITRDELLREIEALREEKEG